MCIGKTSFNLYALSILNLNLKHSMQMWGIQHPLLLFLPRKWRIIHYKVNSANSENYPFPDSGSKAQRISTMCTNLLVDA